MNLRSNRYYPSGSDIDPHRSTTIEIFNENNDPVPQFLPIPTNETFIDEKSVDNTSNITNADTNNINDENDHQSSLHSLPLPSMPSTSKIVITDNEIFETPDLDTNEIAAKVDKELESLNIQRQLFCRHILHCGSTKLFNLLRRPRPWSEMIKHPKQYSEKMQSYLRLKKWLELPKKQRHDELLALNEWYIHLTANREQELCKPRPSLDRIRGERIKFTQHQIKIMEEYFEQNPYLTAEKMNELVEKLNLLPQKINEWFHGRRKKWCQQHSSDKEMIENFRQKSRQYRNRRKQIYFNDEQLLYLERTFHENPWLDNERRKSLAIKLNTDEQRIRTWFNNRRNKFKSYQLYITKSTMTSDNSLTDKSFNYSLSKERNIMSKIQLKREQCAVTIQSWWRGYLLRKQLSQQTPKFSIIRERLRFMQQQNTLANSCLIKEIFDLSKLIETNFNDETINQQNRSKNPTLSAINDQIQNGIQLSIEICDIINDFNQKNMTKSIKIKSLSNQSKTLANNDLNRKNFDSKQNKRRKMCQSNMAK